MRFFILAFLGFQALVSVIAAPATNIEKRDTISDILTAIEDTLECTACETLLLILQALAHLGNDPFTETIIAICVDLGIEDADVCEGAIGMDGPILAHDLRNMEIPSLTSQLFCGTIFGLCPYPAVAAYEVSFPEPKPNTSRPSSSGLAPLQVVHFSDIHVDLSYESGASYNCTKNICCRPYTSTDAPGNTSYPCGPYGNVNCDSPLTLEESLYTAIESFASSRAFSIFTGDVVEGAVWLVNETEVTSDLKSAYSHMSGLGLVYGVVGNHDAAPVNSFPPAAVDTTISSQWVYDTLAQDWSGWIGSNAAATADQYGAYSVKYPHGNLRIISFNTNLYYKENWWLYETEMESDPSGQLSWLVSELQAAETAGERVWIMGHMPMGTSDAFHDGSNYFDQIINRYEATIAALFYGHTHKDEFEIAYTDYTNPSSSNAVAISYIAPALTPTSGNPSFRVYSVDPVTFGILDMTEYITNISSPSYQDGPTWQQYYSVKETYGSLLDPPVTDAGAELTPAFWHNVTALFEEDDEVFQNYYNRKNRGYSYSTCNDDCKTVEICQLRAAQAQYNCDVITPGISFRKKRETITVKDEVGECSGAIYSVIFSDWESTIQSFAKVLPDQVGNSFMETILSIIN